jgi:hypothetical protein
MTFVLGLARRHSDTVHTFQELEDPTEGRALSRLIDLVRFVSF